MAKSAIDRSYVDESTVRSVRSFFLPGWMAVLPLVTYQDTGVTPWYISDSVARVRI